MKFCINITFFISDLVYIYFDEVQNNLNRKKWLFYKKKMSYLYTINAIQ